jgi:hypothetical protein
MPQNDHYVSQTYFKQFTSADGTLVPYYKNMRVIVGKPKQPVSICHEVDGDMNTYFDDPRILDKYLQPIETAWATNVDALKSRQLNAEQKYQLAKYVAYLRVCNPVAKRMSKSRLEAMLRPLSDKVIGEALNNPSIDQPPLDESTRAQLLEKFKAGDIKPDVDQEYASARGIEALSGLADRLYCSPWMVSENHTDIPFLTSDNPAVIYRHTESLMETQVYVPLSPKLALLIAPGSNKPPPTKKDVAEYTNPDDRFGIVKRDAVKRFNVCVVKGAEKLVLHASVEAWIEGLASKYGSWRMQHLLQTIPHGNGVLQIHREQAAES